MYAFVRLFSDVITNAPDATEIELTKDGRWHVTKTEEVDDDTPCHSPNPDNAVEGDALILLGC